MSSTSLLIDTAEIDVFGLPPLLSESAEIFELFLAGDPLALEPKTAGLASDSAGTTATFPDIQRANGGQRTRQCIVTVEPFPTM